jgi:hypothetical protein
MDIGNSKGITAIESSMAHKVFDLGGKLMKRSKRARRILER